MTNQNTTSHSLENLVVMGHSYPKAPLDLRSQLHLVKVEAAELLANRQAHFPWMNGLALLMTCNRSEYIMSLKPVGEEGGLQVADALESFLRWCEQKHAVDYDTLREYVHCYSGINAFNYLVSVASGLESQVLGEPQILGQYRASMQEARQGGYLDPLLSTVGDQTLFTAKEIRAKTSVGKGAVSLASLGVRKCLQVLSHKDLQHCKVAIIGVGDTGSLIVNHLKKHGVKDFVLSSRRGLAPAGLEDLPQMRLNNFLEHMHDFDLIASATASSVHVIGLGAVKTALKKRHNNPMIFLDLAVPRDVEPAVDNLPDAFVFDLESLTEDQEVNRDKREKAASEVSPILKRGGEQCLQKLRRAQSGEVLTGLRELGSEVISETTKQAITAFPELAKEIEEIAGNVAPPMLHLYSKLVERLARYESPDELAKSLEELRNSFRELPKKRQTPKLRLVPASAKATDLTKVKE